MDRKRIDVHTMRTDRALVRNVTGSRAQIVLRRYLLVLAIVTTTAWTVPSRAFATQYHLPGGFAQFDDCPLANHAVKLCLAGSITIGELTIGNRTVTVDKPILLQGGTIEEEGQVDPKFVGAEGGTTLSKTALNIPGGLTGLGPVTTLRNEVTATIELARPASSIEMNLKNLLGESGVALRLLMKVKLSNAELGNNCYIGSTSNPIDLQLTSGTTGPPLPNKPVKGSVGGLDESENGDILGAPYGVLVDNAFSVPEVSGCTPFYSALASSMIGLPAPAGRNAAVFTGNFQAASATVIRSLSE